MNLNKFAKLVTDHEGLKQEVNIAQVKEILKVVNKLTHGGFYKMIRNILFKK